MKAKVLIAAFLVMFAATVPAIAQGNGNGNGNGGGNSAQTEDDNDTNSAGENGNSGNNGNGNGNKAGASNKPSTSDDVTVVPEADLLSIVKAGQAVSLGSLLPNVQERTGGQIIDAQLVRTDRSLIYVIKVMTPEGHVGTEYYNARSGIHIEAQ